MLRNRDQCVCTHSRSQHSSYNEAVAGPWCNERKCLCHKFTLPPPEMPKDISGMLREAAKVIERDGWCQGSGYGTNGERDAHAAIQHVCNWERNKIMLLEPVLYEITKKPLLQWNEERERCKADVVALFLLAADMMESRQAGQTTVPSASASDADDTVTGDSSSGKR